MVVYLSSGIHLCGIPLRFVGEIDPDDVMRYVCLREGDEYGMRERRFLQDIRVSDRIAWLPGGGPTWAA